MLLVIYWIWDELKALNRLLMALGALSAVLWALMGDMVNTVALIDSLTAMVESMTVHLASAPVHDLMSKLNRVFPMTELVTMLGLLLAAQLAAVLIRVLRSFIPTMGG